MFVLTFSMQKPPVKYLKKSCDQLKRCVLDRKILGVFIDVKKLPVVADLLLIKLYQTAICITSKETFFFE